MNEILYESKEIKSESSELCSDTYFEITLHFLSKVETFIMLYETKIELKKPDKSNTLDPDYIIKELRKMFNQVDSSISLIKGKIREIFLSYSY